MPWTCQTCAVDVNDSDPCPQCGVMKTAWTVIEDVTRTFVMKAPRKFTLLKGSGEEAQPAGAAVASLDQATIIRVLGTAAARALSEQGQVPASRDVLFVSVLPGARTDRTLEAEVLFASRPSEVHEVGYDAPPSGESIVYVPLVFVYGSDGADGISFQGMQVIDLSEETEQGFAPEVELATLGLSSQALPTEPALTWIELELLAEDGSPLAGEPYVLTLPDGTVQEGTLDPSGLARIEGIGAGLAKISFPQSAFEELADASWLELCLLDEDGSPRTGEQYEVNLDDGSTRTGVLDAAGLARLEGVPAGTAQVTFPNLGSSWEAK